MLNRDLRSKVEAMPEIFTPKLKKLKNIFKVCLANFYSLKAHSFGWESFVIFLATQGQRFSGAAVVRTKDPQIPSLMPWQ